MLRPYTQERLISAWLSARSDQILRCRREKCVLSFSYMYMYNVHVPIEATAKTQYLVTLMSRRICIFAFHSLYFVGFLLQWLIHVGLYRLKTDVHRLQSIFAVSTKNLSPVLDVIYDKTMHTAKLFTFQRTHNKLHWCAS